MTDPTDPTIEKDEPYEIPSKAKLATKLVSNLAAGTVSAVVVSIIHQNTTTYTKTQTVKLYVGAYILGAMAADKAADYVEAKIEPTLTAIENFLWIDVEPDPAQIPKDLKVKLEAIFNEE